MFDECCVQHVARRNPCFGINRLARRVWSTVMNPKTALKRKIVPALQSAEQGEWIAIGRRGPKKAPRCYQWNGSRSETRSNVARRGGRGRRSIVGAGARGLAHTAWASPCVSKQNDLTYNMQAE
eukprot:6185556-Pleurochrysis_carterae.AAC.1